MSTATLKAVRNPIKKTKTKTIGIPKITIEKMEISTNTIITISFLLVTFFIGYLISRVDKIETKIDANKKELETKIEKLQTQVTNVEKQVIEINVNQQIVLETLKNIQNKLK